MKILSLLVCCAFAALLLVSPVHAQNKSKVKKIDLPAANAEVCLGNSITPKATFTNVSAEAINIKTQLLIFNAITGEKIYGDTVARIGVAAGADVTVTFKTLQTDPNNASHLGRFNVVAIGPVMNNAHTVISDALPADDTMRSVLFGIKRMTMPLYDHGYTYNVVGGGTGIPDQKLWLSVGATVVEGDSATFDPPTPRSRDAGYGQLKLFSPVIKIDRLDHAGVTYTGTSNGDTISSYPINLQGATKALLTFDYHRSTKRIYRTWYDTTVQFGPEATVLKTTGGVYRNGDSLVLEFKKPSEPACDPAANGWHYIASIDGGKDLEFQHISIPIESKNKPGINYFTSDFRFRLRLKAKADAPLFTQATDDEDAWYIDNVQLSRPTKPDHRVNWVRIVSPYTKVPATQAIFPVYVKLTSNYEQSANSDVLVEINGPDGQVKYSRWMNIRFPAQRDTIVRFPDYDARGTMITQGRECKVRAQINPISFFDDNMHDNYATSSFFLNVESEASLTHEFAYDDAGIVAGYQKGNDLLFSNGQGRGVGFNNSSGSYAMRIKLMARDTLYGVQAYFSWMNGSPDAIRFCVYHGSDSSDVPGKLVVYKGDTAKMAAERRGSMFDQYWPYYFPKPIVLDGPTDSTSGVYWVSVSQLSLDNMALGADMSRTGFDFTKYNTNGLYEAAYIHRDKYGTQFSPTQNSGDISKAFAFEITAGTGNWMSLDPNQIAAFAGNPWAFYGRFAYTPMIRAMFGRQTLLPVEFVQPLRAIEQEGGALLTWITAMEKNNAGFRIERRSAGEEWTNVGFVTSRTPNASTPSGYSFVDRAITAGTYIYRLVQIDLDGTESISTEAELTLSAAMQLAEFSPTPFDPRTQSTRIALPTGTHRIRVIDPLGRIIFEREATGEFIWNGRDAQGNLQSPGAYIIAIDGVSRKVVVK
jgi:hypothetical protein